MAEDGKSEKASDFKGMTMAIEAVDDAEAKRVFTALGQGRNVSMPLMKSFWAPSFGMLTDKFGVPWMVNVAAPRALPASAMTTTSSTSRSVWPGRTACAIVKAGISTAWHLPSRAEAPSRSAASTIGIDPKTNSTAQEIGHAQ
jgi:hypothetical protein